MRLHCRLVQARPRPGLRRSHLAVGEADRSHLVVGEAGRSHLAGEVRLGRLEEDSRLAGEVRPKETKVSKYAKGVE